MNGTPLLHGGRAGGLLAITAIGGVLVGLIAGPVLAGATAPRAYPIVAAASDTTNEHTIAVAGSGKVTVVPDMATVNLGVVVEKPTAKAARESAAESMTAVVAAIRKLGIEDKDIATATVSLGPVYDYAAITNAQRIRGYQVQNSVTVTVRNLDLLSDLLDNSVAAGATSVDGVTFDVADRTGAESKARQAAVQDAKAKADTLANGAGVHITGVSSMSESVSTPIWYGVQAAGAAAAPTKDASTPVLPGTTDITITVQVTYLID